MSARFPLLPVPKDPPLHLGKRYDRAGVFQPEPGNTVVCHLIVGSETQRALADARHRHLAMPEANQLAMTPLSSLHMTLFQGIIEGRRALPFWPADVSLDTPIDEMTSIFSDRLRAFPAGPAFSVEVLEARPTGLVVDGITAADRAAMRLWRDTFAEFLGYRHPDHDSYVFHVTFAYMIDWLPEAAVPRWEAMLAETAADIRRRAPVLELKPPAFCSFADMNHFEELLVFEPA